jgi:membrane protein implicated in regulation of membrane protease activity
MTHQQTFSSPDLMGLLRAGLAALIAAAFIALVFVLAAFVTMAALVAAGVATLGASAWWLYRKVRGHKAPTGPTVLVARRGPQGWTVDGEDQTRDA